MKLLARYLRMVYSEALLNEKVIYFQEFMNITLNIKISLLSAMVPPSQMRLPCHRFTHLQPAEFVETILSDPLLFVQLLCL